MKCFLFIFFLMSISNAQDFSLDKFTITPNAFFEDKLVTFIDVNNKRPQATSFATTVFRLSPKFRVQLYTTEFRYFEKSSFRTYEVQGNLLMNVIYKGKKELKIRELKIVLEDGSDFDLEFDSDPSIHFIEKLNEYRSTVSFVIPFEVLYEILISNKVELRFRGAYIFKKVILNQKAKKFLSVFYGTVKGYYGELF